MMWPPHPYSSPFRKETLKASQSWWLLARLLSLSALQRRASSRSLSTWTSSESLLQDILFSPPSISVYPLSSLDHGISGLAIEIHFSINQCFPFFFPAFSILPAKCILKRPSSSSHPFPTKYYKCGASEYVPAWPLPHWSLIAPGGLAKQEAISLPPGKQPEGRLAAESNSANNLLCLPAPCGSLTVTKTYCDFQRILRLSSREGLRVGWEGQEEGRFQA